LSHLTSVASRPLRSLAAAEARADKLARKLRGETERKTPNGGRIDIITTQEIIKVKQIKRVSTL
jgi:hypothetical protein